MMKCSLAGGCKRSTLPPTLKDEETIRAYLQAALDDPTPEALWLALGNVAEALERISANKQVRD
ncbi:hypothetical protein ACM73B_22035 [Pseudomonas aeruginosa]|uniref:hypothetical protein n=1 Tax=Pseudomonas aeruginosa TaxID=287 RepID=UPI0024A68302|nr:hypothetical protein [Pseudomonas aeruginosa]